MSYDIYLYRTETKEKQIASNNNSFWDAEENLVPFTEQQYQYLKERLLKYGYKITKEEGEGLNFEHPDEDFGRVLIAKGVVCFTADWNEDAIFEVGMTVSEFTDTGEFAKYDPQNNGWEEV